MPTISRRALLGSAAGAAGLGAGAAPSSGKTRAHPLEGIGREQIKITDVKVTPASCELKEKSWLTGRQLIWKADAVLVEVFTDKGIVGIGESSPYGGPELIKRFVEENIRPGLMGKNPFDVEHLTGCWPRSARGGQVSWAGIDAALWDIIGKARNKPVYELLATEGKANPHIRMYASGGVEYAWYKRPEALIEEAVRHKENGYTAFKFRIGTEWKPSGITVKTYIPYLYKLRQAVGPNFDLIQEINMRLSLAEVLELCPVLEELKFLWLEEPINQRAEGALEGHLKIKQALPTVKVSGGESLTTRTDFKEWIDRGAYDIVQPDSNSAGVTESWHIAKVAGLKGKICCPHNWHGGLTTMANAALVAGISNHLMLELNQTFNPLKEEVFKEPLVVKKGYMDLPRKPGFGVEVIPNLAQRFPYLPGNYSKPNPELS